MLFGKFTSVTPDGQYVQRPHAKLSYGGVRCLSQTSDVVGPDTPVHKMLFIQYWSK